MDEVGDVRLREILVKALGAANGAIILYKFRPSQPQFRSLIESRETSLPRVYSLTSIITCPEQLCCRAGDGNSEIGDSEFNATRSFRGCGNLAAHASYNRKMEIVCEDVT